jgi:hypothetical protein
VEEGIILRDSFCGFLSKVPIDVNLWRVLKDVGKMLLSSTALGLKHPLKCISPFALRFGLQMICSKQCLCLVLGKYHYGLQIVTELVLVGGGGKEEWGEFVACGKAILISMSRDRPVLSGVEGGGGKT